MCYNVFLHDVQCCYMLPSVITCCAVLLHVRYYMMCSVVRCFMMYILCMLLHVTLCC